MSISTFCGSNSWISSISDYCLVHNGSLAFWGKKWYHCNIEILCVLYITKNIKFSIFHSKNLHIYTILISIHLSYEFSLDLVNWAKNWYHCNSKNQRTFIWKIENDPGLDLICYKSIIFCLVFTKWIQLVNRQMFEECQGLLYLRYIS